MTNPEETKNTQAAESGEDMTMDQSFAEQDAMQEQLNTRETANANVVQISQDNVLVDTGDKK